MWPKKKPPNITEKFERGLKGEDGYSINDDPLYSDALKGTRSDNPVSHREINLNKNIDITRALRIPAVLREVVSEQSESLDGTTITPFLEVRFFHTASHLWLQLLVTVLASILRHKNSVATQKKISKMLLITSLKSY